MPEAYFLPHLGLGDHIICNGLLRELRKKFDIVYMPVKQHNTHSVRDLFRDDPGIEIIPVRGDNDAKSKQSLFARHVDEVIGVGNFGTGFLENCKSFDESFYIQCGVSFKERWSSFFYKRDLEKEEELYHELATDEPYIFVHDDLQRDYIIDEKHFLDGAQIIRPIHRFGEESLNSLFHYGKLVEGAQEIHCIDSSFACYIEHLNTKKVKKMVLHRYIKQQKELQTHDKNHPFFPQYKKKWEII
tara:strand:+ start:447 stop:1178 length:732 start_codon:yes stop_codon:yes gene_type:complete